MMESQMEIEKYVGTLTEFRFHVLIGDRQRFPPPDTRRLLDISHNSCRARQTAYSSQVFWDQMSIFEHST